MDVTDFSNNFLGDFNIDLMHYNEHKPASEFLDSLTPYLSYIIQPSLHTSD